MMNDENTNLLDVLDDCEELITDAWRCSQNNCDQLKAFNAELLPVERLFLWFDYGLQMTLFTVAVAVKKRLNAEDITLMKYISLEGDLFRGDIFRDEIVVPVISGGNVITWDNISNFPQLHRQLVQLMYKQVSPFIQKFVTYITICEQFAPPQSETFMWQIQKKICLIAAFLLNDTDSSTFKQNMHDILVYVNELWALETQEDKIRKQMAKKISSSLSAAQPYYQTCENIIREVGAQTQNTKAELKVNSLEAMSSEGLLKQFDYGLQYTLLNFALTVNGTAEGKHANELDIEFIKEIVQHGDIFSDKLDISIVKNWDDVLNRVAGRNAVSITAMLLTMQFPIEYNFGNFIKHLAKIEKLFPGKNFLSQIEIQVVMILTTFQSLHDSDSYITNDNYTWLQKLWANYH